MLKPLVELGNLKHLGEEELHQAARLILEGRTATRVTKNAADAHALPINRELRGTSNGNELVPQPGDEQ